MNIAVVNDFFPPNHAGGADLFLKSLCNYLSHKGFNIILLTSQQVKGATGFKTYKIRSSPFQISHMQQIPGFTLPWLFFNYSLRKKIKNVYKKEHIDLVYLNNIYHLSFAPLQAALDLKIPTILDVHDYWPICFSKDKYRNDEKICKINESWKCSLCLARKFHFPLSLFSVSNLLIESKLKNKILRKGINKIICHSKNGIKELKKHGFNSISIPYPYLGPISKKQKTKKNKIYRLLFCSRLKNIRGADLLIPIAKKLKSKIKFRIDVIGRGPLEKKLDRKDLNIYTHGFMGKERFEYFKKADCLLALHKYPVPFGIIVIEAMAYETPVIALEGTGPAELIKENGIGIVCKKNNLISSLLKLRENKELIERIRKNEHKNLKKYSKKRIFNEYEKIFRIYEAH